MYLTCRKIIFSGPVGYTRLYYIEKKKRTYQTPDGHLRARGIILNNKLFDFNPRLVEKGCFILFEIVGFKEMELVQVEIVRQR